MKLSACVCVHNEEKRLTDCLDRLGFADEIIVVLDRCTDGSKDIALRYTSKIIEGDFPLEGARRMAALNAVTGDWCLEIDCDETVPAALADEIRTVVSMSYDDWHLIPIDNYIGDHLVRQGWGASFGTSQVGRLSRRGIKQWGHQHVHPEVKFNGTRGATLKNALQHKVDDSVQDMIARLNRYSDLRAADIRAGNIAKHEKETLSVNIGRFFTRFYKCYVVRHGYKEGHYGFLIALCAGLFPLLSYLKASLEGPRH